MIGYYSSKSLFFASALSLLVLASGCNDNSAGRVAVWGNVTWKGQAVPKGVVYFSPDTKKGNKGPQGYALIKDGRFDTRDAMSKGCVTGSQVAIVHGCSGEGVNSRFPYGRNLFAPFEISLDVPAEGGQTDLIIPESAPRPAATLEMENE